jgi:hypothetical protein
MLSPMSVVQFVPNNNTLLMGVFVKEATESLLMSLGGGTTINQFIPRTKTG